MQILAKILLDIMIVIAIIGTIFFIYRTYQEPIATFFFGEQKIGMFIRDIPLTVSVADSPSERALGLSGVKSLPEREGKLFIFDIEGRYGFWMKDMLFPIDILWIDNSGKIVHIEENVRIDSYPTIYTTPVPARFVLEVNAFFVSTFHIDIGDQVTIPSHWLPADLQIN